MGFFAFAATRPMVFTWVRPPPALALQVIMKADVLAGDDAGGSVAAGINRGLPPTHPR